MSVMPAGAPWESHCVTSTSGSAALAAQASQRPCLSSVEHKGVSTGSRLSVPKSLPRILRKAFKRASRGPGSLASDPMAEMHLSRTTGNFSKKLRASCAAARPTLPASGKRESDK